MANNLKEKIRLCCKKNEKHSDKKISFCVSAPHDKLFFFVQERLLAVYK